MKNEKLEKFLRIDGSSGEGGGQILRTSLSLSVLTGRPIEIFNIRAGRKKPGLQRQHLVCVEAVTKISDAKVSGAKIGLQFLRFEPKKVKPGRYEFDIGTAGSTSLVIQTILLPLSFSHRPSEILLIGGTHNPFAPPFHYLKEVFLPVVGQLGIQADVKLEKWGFYPKGGGRVRLFIEPVSQLKAKNFLERGELKELTGLSAVASAKGGSASGGNLPISIAERQKTAFLKKIGAPSSDVDIKIEQVRAASAGTFVFLKAKFSRPQSGSASGGENMAAGFSALGERGKPAEKVGQEAAQKFIDYYRSGKCFDPHLADQIILYLALVKQPFSFTTSRITNHLLTHIWLLEQFLSIKIKVDEEENKVSYGI